MLFVVICGVTLHDNAVGINSVHIMNSFDFSDDNVFLDYLNMIKNPHSVSVNKRNTELTTDDKILVLSTCLNSGDGRYLVQGVLKKDEPTK